MSICSEWWDWNQLKIHQRNFDTWLHGIANETGLGKL